MKGFSLRALLLGLLFGTVETSLGSDVHLGEAGRLYNRGEYALAAEVLLRHVRADPADGALRMWLGKTYLRVARFDDAVRELEAASRIQPQNGEIRLWLGRAYGRKAEHASFLTALGWAHKVRKEFEACIRLDPDNFDARFDLLEYLMEAPGIVGGGTDHARQQVAEIARLQPKLGFVARALLMEREKKWDDARGELMRATEEFPERIEMHLDLAEFLIRRKDLESAEKSARRAIRINSGSARAQLVLAIIRIESKLGAVEALQALKELAAGDLRDHDPAFSEVHYWWGRAALLLGRGEEARSEFETALRFDPDHTKAKEALSQLRKPV